MAPTDPQKRNRRAPDDCVTPPAADKGSPARAIRPSDDPAEAVERIVPKRHLLVEKGDIFISRAVAPIKGAGDRDIYQLVRHQVGPVPGRFTTFEHAVAAGDELATMERVRLYFKDSPDHPAQLLKDCRPA